MSVPGKPLITVRDLRVVVRRTGETVRAVDGLSFDLGGGESLGIAGESGSGKSLTALALARLFPQGVRLEVSGEIRVTLRDGRQVEILSAAPEELRDIRGREIGMIFQEPRRCLNPVMRIGDQIAEGLRRHQGLERRAALARALELLERVRMPDPGRVLASYPHELSGGMQQRAMIAMALGPTPRVLVADEPTTDLDVLVQARILELLREIREEEGMALILVSHDLRVLASMTERVLVMRAGIEVEERATDELFDPEHYGELSLYTRALLACRPHVGGGKGPLPTAADPAPRPRVTAGPTAGLSGSGMMESWSGTIRRPGEPLLVVRDLTKTYAPRGLPGRRGSEVRALRGVSFALQVSQTLGLVGASGSGKTTLARCLLRLEEPTAGAVMFKGREWLKLKGRELRRRRRSWQAVFQDPRSALDPRFPVLDSVAEGLLARRMLPRAEIPDRVAELLQTVGLPRGFMDRLPHELSGGERQRVTIARALATDPALIVLDEAVSSLDVSIQAEIINLLLDIQERRGIAYLFISHDLAVIERVSDTIGVLDDGHLVELGPAAEVLGSPRNARTKELLAAAI